jgi:hypothetical protein
MRVKATRSVSVFVGVGVALVVGVGLGARALAKSHAKPPAAILTGNVMELHVPPAKGAIMLDGDMDDPGWLHGCARTNAFLTADGDQVRPYSDARFVYADGFLYVGLYAADEDIHAKLTDPDSPVWTEDSFHVVFNDGTVEHSFDISPLGTLADGERKIGATGPGGTHPFDFAWTSGAHVSHEMDGTPNKSTDNDEEWLIEMAIPLEALGLKGEKGERIGVAIHRCDTFHSGIRSCGAWGEGEKRGVLVFD